MKLNLSLSISSKSSKSSK